MFLGLWFLIFFFSLQANYGPVITAYSYSFISFHSDMEASDPSTFYLVGTKPGRSLTLSLPSSPSSPSHMCYLLKRKLDRPFPPSLQVPLMKCKVSISASLDSTPSTNTAVSEEVNKARQAQPGRVAISTCSQASLAIM